MKPTTYKRFDWLNPIRQWLTTLEIQNPKAARLLCKVIPAHCPFERDVKLFGWLFHIPPLCKLNPLYEQIVELRFKCLSFLADQCGEDITVYYAP